MYNSHFCIDLNVSKFLHCTLIAEIRCECGNPPGLRNGDVSPNRGPVPCNQFVNYQCNTGYILQGNSRLQCLNNQYSGSAPFCQQGQYTLHSIVISGLRGALSGY